MKNEYEDMEMEIARHRREIQELEDENQRVRNWYINYEIIK